MALVVIKIIIIIIDIFFDFSLLIQWSVQGVPVIFHFLID